MSKQGGAGTRAYHHIKQQLFEGRLAEGTFLAEGAVAEELGVSRTPVREALQRLDAEKLVSLVPGRGALVPHVTIRTMREVMQARELIEVYALENIDTPAPELVEELRSVLKQQGSAHGDAVDFIVQDRGFHQRLVDAAGNQVIAELYSSLRDRQTLLGVRAVTTETSRFDEIEREHRLIVDAIESGDHAAAVNALRIHLQTSVDVLMAGLSA